MRSAQVEALRAALSRPGLEERRTRIALGIGAVDACLKGGLARGACHEVYAHPGHEGAATGFAAGLAWRAASAKPLLWIRQDFSALEFGELAATGLVELGIDPSRVLLLRTAHAEDALRAALDALSCAALGAVAIELVGEPRILDLTASRRLTLAAAESGVSVLLLRFGAQPQASSAATRWLIRSAPSPRGERDWGRPAFAAELVRNRHGGTGNWVMEWDCDDGCFRETSGGAVVPAPCDRPAAAALEAHRRSAA